MAVIHVISNGGTQPPLPIRAPSQPSFLRVVLPMAINNVYRYKSNSTNFSWVFDRWNYCSDSSRNSVFTGIMDDLDETEVAEKVQDDVCRLFLLVTDLCR